MPVLSKRLSDFLYVFGLVVLAVNLPLSPFVVTVAMFLLIINWLFGASLKTRYDLFKKNRILQAFLLIYITHVIWMLNTEDIVWGLHNLRIKLPVLIIPLIVGTSVTLHWDKLKIILLFFIAGVLVNSLISTTVYLAQGKGFYNVREISLFISHIRFSLMVVISIITLVYFIFSNKIQKSKAERNIYAIVIVWLTVFLFILQSFTGIFVILILVLPLIYWMKNQVSKPILRHSLIYSSLFVFLFVSINLGYALYLFYRNADKNIKTLDVKTINENPYIHKKGEKENGHYINYYVCWPELKNEWGQVSDIKLSERDKSGQPIKYTLIRYLTSKGYRKDSIGVSKLTAKDIALIENGVANYIYGKKIGLYPRFYELIWEIDRYKKGGNPLGHSVIQRIDFINKGISVIKQNFWMGTGTGDVVSSFRDNYKNINPKLHEKIIFRPHNQYITLFMTFGLVGFVVVLFALTYPLLKLNKKNAFIAYINIAVLLISMLNEDTLETHVGVSLFAFIYSMFIFADLKSKNQHTIVETVKDFKKHLSVN